MLSIFCLLMRLGFFIYLFKEYVSGQKGQVMAQYVVLQCLRGLTFQKEGFYTTYLVYLAGLCVHCLNHIPYIVASKGMKLGFIIK